LNHTPQPQIEKRSGEEEERYSRTRFPFVVTKESPHGDDDINLWFESGECGV